MLFVLEAAAKILAVKVGTFVVSLAALLTSLPYFLAMLVFALVEVEIFAN
jgi:hypothetical protein